MNKKGSGSLKILGILLIIFGLIYGILGTLCLAGTIEGLLPGHEEQEAIVIILSYVISLLAIIGGIASIISKLKLARVIGLIFAIVGLGSLIYTQLAHDAFNIFDCIAMVLGVAIFYLAKSDKKN